MSPPRRLGLLPEVLPAPTRASRTSTVRDRTVAHMQRLLATSAALAANGCSREAAPPPLVTAGDGRDAGPVPTGRPTTSATVAPVNTAPSIGYGVVDQMPRPALCRGLAAMSNATATLRHATAGWLVDIVVVLPTGPAARGMTFDTSSQPNSQETILSASVQPGRVALQLKVLASGRPGQTEYANANFTVKCPTGDGTLAAQLTYVNPPREGGAVSVSLQDY